MQFISHGSAKITNLPLPHHPFQQLQLPGQYFVLFFQLGYALDLGGVFVQRFMDLVVAYVCHKFSLLKNYINTVSAAGAANGERAKCNKKTKKLEGKLFQKKNESIKKPTHIFLECCMGPI